MGSAVVIVVPEAEQYVGDLRNRFDPVAARGVPAHVSVLYPFRDRLDAETDAAVAAIAARTAPFDLAFGPSAVFPDGVVYLVPKPDAAVRRLIAAFAERFPDCPPYGGEIDDPVPHLTVGHRVPAAAASELVAELDRLPTFATRVDGVAMLVEGPDGRWSVAKRWPFDGVDA